MVVRPAIETDAASIAAIYNQAIEARTSTFETRPRTRDDVLAWFDGVHPIVAVEEQGQVIAYAATFPYSDRECYRGVAEFSVYVDRRRRGRGAGRQALSSLIEAAGRAGFWKLVSRIFPENADIRRLNKSLGIREVGVHEKHGQLEGVWRDVIVVERLIVKAAACTIRRAAAQDHAAWIEMRQSLWPECPYAEQLVEVSRTLASEIQAVFVAESATGELCGFMEMALREFASGCATSPVGYIEGWYVKPQFHRQGIGRALVAAGEQWAVERGCVEMASDAVIGNAVSQQAHRALGYEESERLVCFRKLLTASKEGSEPS